MISLWIGAALLALTVATVVLAGGCRAAAVAFQIAVVIQILVPKAGIKSGAIPFPVSLAITLLCSLLVLAVMRRTPETQALTARNFFAVMWALWVAFVVLRQVDSGAPTVVTVTTLIWTLPPLLVFAAAAKARAFLDDTTLQRFRCKIVLSFIAVTVFGLIQLILGLQRTSIPGLTLALHDSYASKPLIFDTAMGTGTKIPSTYQNGNILGAVAAVFFVLMILWKSQQPTSTRGYWLAGLLSSGGLVLMAGSRTAVLAAALGVVVLTLTGRGSRLILPLSALATVSVVVFLIDPPLGSRLSLSSLTDTSGSGRTAAWHAIMSVMSWRQYLMGDPRTGSSVPLTEGWLGIVQQVGLVGVLIAAGGLLTLTRRSPKEWWAPVALCVLFIAAVDSSYIDFPTIFSIGILISVWQIGPSNNPTPSLSLRSALPGGVGPPTHELDKISEHTDRRRATVSSIRPYSH